ncbi:hypothetical protein VT569_03140 [Flavobacterium psychrophilum]|uniref:hypothetical protein n=1 Tax=Flavobacterium psychrophilum TaxID=96345 RepID=UPI003B4327FC
MKYTTGKTDYKAITEAIGKLKTLKEKLQYYNDNYQILILRNVSRSLNAKIIYYNDYTVYCTCKDCESKFLITDFEVYRDFVNNQTDAIVKYFNETTNYKAKLEYYYKLNDGYPQKTKLVLKYVPNSKDDVKDYYNLKEVSIDVTPQNEIEFNILLDLKKSIILNSENNQKPQRTPIHKGTEYYNASRFIYENRVDEVTNYLELVVDENDRKDLIKKYLDSVNLDKIDFEKIKIKRKFTYEFLNYEILKIANKIIQKINYDEVVNTTIFFEVENYLLALETIKFKKYLNSLLFLIPQQNQTDGVTLEQKTEIRKPQTKAVPENPHPTIFTGIDNKNFTLFETFTKHHILDKYVDFSFIFQQMKFNGYILDIKHLKFMKWLHENNYITQKEYSEDFLIEKGFRSLKKCAYGTRVNSYLKLQDSIILSSSDLSE